MTDEPKFSLDCFDGWTDERLASYLSVFFEAGGETFGRVAIDLDDLELRVYRQNDDEPYARLSLNYGAPRE